MKVAILGTPQSGRTTLFRYLGGFGKKQDRLPPLAQVHIPDRRLDLLEKEYSAKKYTTAEFELHDTVGDFETDGRTLEPVRPSDAVIWQFRAFDEGFGKPDPASDYELLKSVVIEKDTQILEKRLENLERSLSRGMKGDEKKRLEKEKEWILTFIDHMKEEKSIRMLELDEAGRNVVRNFGLISAKPALIHISCDEENFAKKDELLKEIRERAEETKNIGFAASMPMFELELAELPEEESEIFREDAGLVESSKDTVVKGVFDASKKHVFLTAGEKEVRSWLIPQGATALEAAGAIHSDIAQGFIRAETLAWADYDKYGSYRAAKDEGKVRLEGKEYVIEDGDIILFRFNI